MKKICIWGGWYGSRNAGDMAILLALIQVLETKLGETHITVFSANPNFVRKEFGVQSFAPRKQPLSVVKAISKADLIILGGGTPFYDSLYQIFTIYFYVSLTKIFRRKFMVYAVSVQAFDRGFSKALIRFVLNMADVITVRDPESINLLRDMGITKEIIPTADPAILLSPHKSRRVEELISTVRSKSSDKPLIGICPRYLSATEYRSVYHQKLTRGSIDNFKKSLASALERISEFAEIVIIPFHTEFPDDDRRMISELIALTTLSKDITVLEDNYSPKEIMGVIKEMDLIIGVRLHSLIFATIGETPMVAISYGSKVKGFMESIGQQKYTCPVEDFTSEDLLIKVEEILDNVDFVKKGLKANKKKLTGLALKNAEMVSILIENQHSKTE